MYTYNIRVPIGSVKRRCFDSSIQGTELYFADLHTANLVDIRVLYLSSVMRNNHK